MKRRVVVTGPGRSLLGHDVQSTWQALLAGQSGVGRITRFDASEFPTAIAAEVRTLTPAAHGCQRSQAQRSLYLHAVVAAKEAWLRPTG